MQNEHARGTCKHFRTAAKDIIRKIQMFQTTPHFRQKASLVLTKTPENPISAGRTSLKSSVVGCCKIHFWFNIHIQLWSKQDV